ncbi:flagellin [Gimibacter soli]|uniref:Flagellin n=1 Tax=Gimibacter soli TaxID=3024400 RepID=A0AAE9XSH8_9PROT|nr:flagellin [Gimibacter soli]WCL53240.1 flagellin [Gimibacter soli]
MTRVSSFGQQSLMVNTLMENQKRVFEGQRQVATGKKTDEYAGLKSATNTVLSSRSFMARVDTFQTTIKTVRGKLDANDVQIEGMLSSMEALKDNIQVALANNQAEGFSELLDQTFKFMVNGLNTNFDGTYLFSGAKTSTVPVNVKTLAELSGLGAVADAFDNSDIGFKAKIADNVDLDFGLVADDVAEESFQVLLDLYNYDQGAGGPLNGELDQTQWDYLQSMLSNITSAIDGLRQNQVKNGLVYERLDLINEQHSDTAVFLEVFIADLEDVDMAEAVTRLNNNQVALEASYQAVSILSDLSLLRYI